MGISVGSAANLAGGSRWLLSGITIGRSQGMMGWIQSDPSDAIGGIGPGAEHFQVAWGRPALGHMVENTIVTMRTATSLGDEIMACLLVAGEAWGGMQSCRIGYIDQAFIQIAGSRWWRSIEPAPTAIAQGTWLQTTLWTALIGSFFLLVAMVCQQSYQCPRAWFRIV